MAQNQLAESYSKQLQEANQRIFELQTAVEERDEKLADFRRDSSTQGADALQEQLSSARDLEKSRRQVISNLMQKCNDKDEKIEELRGQLEKVRQPVTEPEKDNSPSLTRKAESNHDASPQAKKSKGFRISRVEEGFEFKVSIDQFDRENPQLIEGHALPLALQSIIMTTVQLWDLYYNHGWYDYVHDTKTVHIEAVRCVSSQLKLWISGVNGNDGGSYACSELAGMPCFSLEDVLGNELQYEFVLLPLAPPDRAEGVGMEDMTVGRWIREDKVLSDEERRDFFFSERSLLGGL